MKQLFNVFLSHCCSNEHSVLFRNLIQNALPFQSYKILSFTVGKIECLSNTVNKNVQTNAFSFCLFPFVMLIFARVLLVNFFYVWYSFFKIEYCDVGNEIRIPTRCIWQMFIPSNVSYHVSISMFPIYLRTFFRSKKLGQEFLYQRTVNEIVVFFTATDIFGRSEMKCNLVKHFYLMKCIKSLNGINGMCSQSAIYSFQKQSSNTKISF